MSKSKQKLIIIDGNALIHRSFHAIPLTLRIKDGTLVNAVYGFTSFLLKALNEFKPEFIVLTLDRKGPTFRHKAYSKYKATRVKAPDELYGQIPLIKKIAKSFDIPIFELDGFEADDLIGTICEQTKIEKNLEKIIITGDLDTLQLVNNNTKVYTMSHGLSAPVIYDGAQVQKRFSLNPDQIIDYKSLRGDPSDNIPGVHGIGEKTAVELLNKFKTLDGVYAGVKNKNPQIKERILKLLTTSKDDAYLSQKLATIDLQAPIKFILDEASCSHFEFSEVINLFSKLEFRSLLPRLKDWHDNIYKNQKKSEDKNEEEKDKTKNSQKNSNYQLIATDKEFDSFYKKLANQKIFTIATENLETSNSNLELNNLSFSWKKNEAYFLEITPSR
jgi:DNA polymerase-1